jgi:hypothetical protein
MAKAPCRGTPFENHYYKGKSNSRIPSLTFGAIASYFNELHDALYLQGITNGACVQLGVETFFFQNLVTKQILWPPERSGSVRFGAFLWLSGTIWGTQFVASRSRTLFPKYKQARHQKIANISHLKERLINMIYCVDRHLTGCGSQFFCAITEWVRSLEFQSQLPNGE